MTDSFHTMTDAELVTALRDLDPLASNLSALLIEMWKRGLREAESYGCKLMAGNHDGNLHRHPDARLYDVLEIMCGCFNQPIDAQGWLVLASGYEQRIRDTLMFIAVRDNPKVGYEVLAVAERDGDCHVLNDALRSVIHTVPATEPSLSECLMRWALHRAVTPDTRARIFRRLGELPWTEELENFFIRRCIEDDGSDAALTGAIDDALRKRSR